MLRKDTMDIQYSLESLRTGANIGTKMIEDTIKHEVMKASRAQSEELKTAVEELKRRNEEELKSLRTAVKELNKRNEEGFKNVDEGPENVEKYIEEIDNLYGKPCDKSWGLETRIS